MPAPPWSQVIATTVRLWWQRHVAPTAPGARRLRRAGIGALVCALLLASTAAIYLGHARGGARPSGHRGATAASVSGSDPYALTAATQVRQRAAAWVATQVSHSVIVGCDPLMCSALEQHGFPAANLAPIQAGTGDPLGSGIVMSTAAVRSQFGPRLTSVWAPQAIASFGMGEDLVQVLVTAPRGAAAYRSGLQADLNARKTGGRDLLGNANVHVSTRPRQQLAAGLVDTRLLITLAALAHSYPLYIRGFTGLGPGASPGTPLRAAAITTTSASYLRDMLAFLRAQRVPLLAQTAELGAGRTTVVEIEFSAPSPTGLLPQG
jgi:hypothetical protein